MGRSVSVASGAFAVAYKDCSRLGYVTEDENGKELAEPYYDELLGQDDWDCWIESIVEKMKHYFPSFAKCDKWLGREDRAILENSFAYFGISEYCGLVSLWLVAKDGDEQAGLRKRWTEQIVGTFEKQFSELKKLGTFSNGEAVFERVKKDGGTK